MPVTLETLTKRADFLRLRRGAKVVTPYFIVRFAPREEPTSATRVGLTVTSKCGNAVVRNRIKRRLRALVREFFPTYAKPAHDYSIIALDSAKPSVQDAPYAELKSAMLRALEAKGGR